MCIRDSFHTEHVSKRKNASRERESLEREMEKRVRFIYIYSTFKHCSLLFDFTRMKMIVRVFSTQSAKRKNVRVSRER